MGKTAVVEGLALRIVSGDVPFTVKEKRVLTPDLSGMVEVPVVDIPVGELCRSLDCFRQYGYPVVRLIASLRSGLRR